PLGPNHDHIGHEAACLRVGAVRNYLAATMVCPALSPSQDRAPCQARRRGRDGASRPQPNCLIFRVLFHPLPSPRSAQRKIWLSPRQSRGNFAAAAILVRALSGLPGRVGEARAITYARRQTRQSLHGPWIPDLRSPGLNPGSLVRDTQFSCPGRVQRALLRERNETRDPARESRSATFHPLTLAWDSPTRVRRSTKHPTQRTMS